MKDSAKFLARYAILAGITVFAIGGIDYCARRESEKYNLECRPLIEKERSGYIEACNENAPDSLLELIINERNNKLLRNNCKSICEIWECYVLPKECTPQGCNLSMNVAEIKEGRCFPVNFDKKESFRRQYPIHDNE